MRRSPLWLGAFVMLPLLGSNLEVRAADESVTESSSNPTTPASSEEVAKPPSNSFEGVWYEVNLECPFCVSFDTQTLALSRDISLIRYSDRLEIAPGMKSAKLVIKGQGGESKERTARGFQPSQKGQIVLIQYAEGDEERSSDTYARVWIFSMLSNGKILYGRRLAVSAFADDAFEVKGKGYRARDKFLPPERLLANLEDVRVYSLNEARKVYQPSPQVRFALEGSVCYVREGVAETDVTLGKEQARKQVQDRVGRENLFKTLVQQGDQAYAAGNFDDALNRYKAASAILPEISLVHADLGAVYQVQNKLPEAEATYRLALELDPLDLDSQFNLAQVLEQANKLGEALKLYKQVLEKRPQDAETKERVTRLGQKLNP